MLRVSPELKERIQRQQRKLNYPSMTAYLLAAAEVHFREGRGSD
jgi:hypothetical protein